MNVGQQIVGGVVVVGVGILVIAGIYQLGKKTNQVTPTVGAAYNQTLSSIFK